MEGGKEGRSMCKIVHVFVKQSTRLLACCACFSYLANTTVKTLAHSRVHPAISLPSASVLPSPPPFATTASISFMQNALHSFCHLKLFGYQMPMVTNDVTSLTQNGYGRTERDSQSKGVFLATKNIAIIRVNGVYIVNTCL